MPRRSVFCLLALAAAGPVLAQTTATEKASITLYSLPAFLGESVTITGATPDLSQRGFANKAQSARVTGGPWIVCRDANYAGQCQTLDGDVPALALVGLGKRILSLRPQAATGTTSGQTTTTGTTTGTATAATPAAALADLDVGEGVEGQDTTFFIRPTLQGQQVSAGTNDRTAADAFCKLAGHTSSLHAGRARAQVSNIWSVTAGTRVRGFPLRDVLCRK